MDPRDIVSCECLPYEEQSSYEIDKLPQYVAEVLTNMWKTETKPIQYITTHFWPAKVPNNVFLLREAPV